ncbi:MAG: hypothetical protein ABFS45_20745 [Pseudomonadota bacterium]
MKYRSSIHSDERDVLDAAALLDTTEYRVFTIAYQRWYGQAASFDVMERCFCAYMFRCIVPPWVRHFTREIVFRARIGTLRPADYGIREQPASPEAILRGRIFTAVLVVLCLILLGAGLQYDDLLQILENCYFPPCY